MPPADDELPLQLGSVREFLRFCINRGVKKRPVMTAAYDGLMQGDWIRDDEKVVILFLGNTAHVLFDLRGRYESLEADCR